MRSQSARSRWQPSCVRATNWGNSGEFCSVECDHARGYEYETTMHFIRKFFDAANQSAGALNRQIIHITQRNLNLSLDLAKSLASARDPSEIVELQASFWWKQFNEFTTQVEEVRKRLFGSTFEHTVRETTPGPALRRPHARPLPEHSPPAQDPDNTRPEQKPAKQIVETPTFAAQTETAESKVGRPTPRLQRSTAEKRSARPRSTSPDSARKHAKRRCR